MTSIVGVRAIEKAIALIQWMDSLKTAPDYQRVMARFDVSRATAYRWIAAYRDSRFKPDGWIEDMSDAR